MLVVVVVGVVIVVIVIVFFARAPHELLDSQLAKQADRVLNSSAETFYTAATEYNYCWN